MTITVKLDENSTVPAYVIGRMLAVYEAIQYAANNPKRKKGEKKESSNVGNTVVDRFYASAATYPKNALAKLDMLSRAHLKKLRRDRPGTAIALEKKLHALYALLPEAQLPTHFNLTSQGIFAIGYHHQAASDAEEREAYIEQRKESQTESDN